MYEKLGGYSKREAAEVVELVFETLKQSLARHDKVKLSGFGNFVVHDKKARMGRNPLTKQPIEISARRVLTFKASQVVNQTLNA